MKLSIVSSEAVFDLSAAELILSRMKTNPRDVIGLSTGRTTGSMHRIVSETYSKNPFDVSGLTFLGIDEVTGIPRSNPWACYAKLKAELIGNLDIPDENFLMLPSSPSDIDEIASNFSAELHKRGGIGLLVLGLGENGHLGFNQPGTPFDSRIHLSVMDDGLERRIREDCGIDDSVKLGGITLGIADIMEARKILLVVKGSNKADILEKVVNGPVTESVPASILQTHPDCIVLADEDAAANIDKYN